MECAPGETDPTECCALKMSGHQRERPPMIRPDQSGVAEGMITFDDKEGPFNIGGTKLSPDCCEKSGNIRSVSPTDDKPNAMDVVENGVY